MQQPPGETITIHTLDYVITSAPSDEYLAEFIGNHICEIRGNDHSEVAPVLARLFKYARTFHCEKVTPCVIPLCINMITHTLPVTSTYQVLISIFSAAIGCGEVNVVARLLTEDIVWLYDRGQLSEDVLGMVCRYGGAGVSDAVCKILLGRHNITGMLENVSWYRIHKFAYGRDDSGMPIHVSMVVLADIIRLEHTVSDKLIHEWDQAIRGFLVNHIREYKARLPRADDTTGGQLRERAHHTNAGNPRHKSRNEREYKRARHDHDGEYGSARQPDDDEDSAPELA